MVWGAGRLVDDSGRTLGAVVVFRDITKRREIERIKDEFVSVVSHELRTPLTSVRGALGLLAGGALGPLNTKAAALARRGLDGAERLTRLVDDLLDVERIESGATTMGFGRCSAAELVAAAVDGVSSLAAEVPVVVRVDHSSATVQADAHRVIQALTNLLSNAIKFSPPNGTIAVSATTRGDMVEFAVADQGRGIPADMLERIFERFEQVDSSDSRRHGGTGLGLAICRTIVRRHGGEIWAESEAERGSVFRFTIPVAEVDTDAEDEPSDPPGAGRADSLGMSDKAHEAAVSSGARAEVLSSV
jgi:signal transduction histidine kinase